MVHLRSFVLFSVASTVFADGQNPHWTYETKGHDWATSFPTCGSHQRQSPIHFTTRDLLESNDQLYFSKSSPSSFDVVDNGHTLMLTPSFREGTASRFVWNDGATSSKHLFEFAQMHFHSPSEHKIGERKSALELHLVHKEVVPADGVPQGVPSSSSLSVIGLLFDPEPTLEDGTRAKTSEGLQSAAADFISEVDALAEGIRKGGPDVWSFDASKENVFERFIKKALMEDRSGMRTYQGSLTTPPCTEDVLWLVADPITLPAKTFKNLVALMTSYDGGMNRRTTQNDHNLDALEGTVFRTRVVRIPDDATASCKADDVFATLTSMALTDHEAAHSDPGLDRVHGSAETLRRQKSGFGISTSTSSKGTSTKGSPAKGSPADALRKREQGRGLKAVKGVAHEASDGALLSSEPLPKAGEGVLTLRHHNHTKTKKGGIAFGLSSVAQSHHQEHEHEALTFKPIDMTAMCPPKKRPVRGVATVLGKATTSFHAYDDVQPSPRKAEAQADPIEVDESSSSSSSSSSSTKTASAAPLVVDTDGPTHPSNSNTTDAPAATPSPKEDAAGPDGGSSQKGPIGGLSSQPLHRDWKGTDLKGRPLESQPAGAAPRLPEGGIPAHITTVDGKTEAKVAQETAAGVFELQPQKPLKSAAASLVPPALQAPTLHPAVDSVKEHIPALTSVPDKIIFIFLLVVSLAVLALIFALFFQGIRDTWARSRFSNDGGRGLYLAASTDEPLLERGGGATQGQVVKAATTASATYTPPELVPPQSVSPLTTAESRVAAALSPNARNSAARAIEAARQTGAVDVSELASEDAILGASTPLATPSA